MLRINKTNIILILIISLSCIFYYYYISTNKGSIKIESKNEKKNISSLESGITKFSNVEYNSFSKDNKSYITRGKQAYISKKQPDLINIQSVHSFTKLNDGSILNIKSDKAKFSKNNKNIKYYQNVIITNKEATITANTADFFANKNIIKLQKVIYKDGQNIIKSDFAVLNTITNNLELLMNNKKDQVYGQRKQ